MACQTCQEEGHREDVCPNLRVERNIAEVKREMAALEDTLEKMTEYADELGEATTEAIALFKGKVGTLFQPLIREAYAMIGKETIRKEQHPVEEPRTSRIGSSLTASKETKETKPERNGTAERINNQKDEKHLDETRCSMSEENICQNHQEARRLLVNLTANGQVIMKQGSIRGRNPRRDMSEEEWENMVDFLVFWNALDVDEEEKLEKEMKDLNEKFPMEQALSEGTEERDKKFLQLEKTKKASRSRGSAQKTAMTHRENEAQEEKVDRWTREKWALENPGKAERARQEREEKLATMHEEGFEDGLAKGQKHKSAKLEPKDKDGLLDGFYENIELATDEQLGIILENARRHLGEAMKEPIRCAKYRASLREITEQQIKEQGFEDGYTRGRIVSKDKLRGIAVDLDVLMDTVYKVISIMRRSGARNREVKDLMTYVKNYMDRRITIHIALDRADENSGGHTCGQAIKSEPQETESEGSDYEENEEKVRTQTTSEPSDEPMDETAAEGNE